MDAMRARLCVIVQLCLIRHADITPRHAASMARCRRLFSSTLICRLPDAIVDLFRQFRH